MTEKNHYTPPSSRHDNPFALKQTPYRWLLLALVWLLYVCFGIILRSASPLITPMLKDLNMSYSQMGFVLGSWQLTYLLVAIAVGGFFGPVIVGYLVDLTGSFMAGAIFLALLGAVIAALTAPLKSIPVSPSKSA